MPSPESTLKHKKLALGRGLSALIPDAGPTFQPEDGFFLCEIDLIRPNRFQPRHQFAEEELAELTGSIREQGVLQPLIVRKSDPGFELIAGERRLRAARRAGLSQVPVVLKAVSDDQLLELSLVENIQRENLNPIEEAEAYHRLIQQLHLTQDQAAARVGKSRSAVANFLRLRQLPEEVKASIVQGGLSMGHARALLGAENGAQQLAAWRAVVARGLSVRETEELVRRLKAEKKKPRASMHGSEAVHLASLSEELSRHLGTKVTIRKSGKQGRVEIEFYGNDDLDRLIARLRRTTL
ncbi:MAG TPA: ParB/RepB/Spo0J family partition protein [Desulfobacterales bacterium]|nr:ParB/RepB/Spo0J family partition protein [Desulfobacterales bacterium]